MRDCPVTKNLLPSISLLIAICRAVSHDPRAVSVGRNFWRSASPTPLTSQGHLEWVTQEHIRMGFECLPGGRLHNLPVQPVPVLCHPQFKVFLTLFLSLFSWPVVLPFIKPIFPETPHCLQGSAVPSSRSAGANGTICVQHGAALAAPHTCPCSVTASTWAVTPLPCRMDTVSCGQVKQSSNF